MQGDKHRLLMIDFDSADIDFIQSHLDYLPTMRRLFNEGRFTRLRSDGGELGASVWASFLTGRHPGDHGQFFPLQWDAQKMKMSPVGEDYHFHDPFWYEIAHSGIPVVAFDVQMPFESRLPLGLEVQNWTAQSFANLRSNQPELLGKIIQRFGPHPMGADIPADWSSAQRHKMKAQMDIGIRQTGESFVGCWYGCVWIAPSERVTARQEDLLLRSSWEGISPFPEALGQPLCFQPNVFYLASDNIIFSEVSRRGGP